MAHIRIRIHIRIRPPFSVLGAGWPLETRTRHPLAHAEGVMGSESDNMSPQT